MPCSTCGMSGHNSRTCRIKSGDIIQRCGVCREPGHNRRRSQKAPKNVVRCCGDGNEESDSSEESKEPESDKDFDRFFMKPTKVTQYLQVQHSIYPYLQRRDEIVEEYRPKLDELNLVDGYTLRGTVPKVCKIWEHNGNKDAYTNIQSIKMENVVIERDHVIEVQILDYTFNNKLVGVKIRGDHSILKGVLNSIHNMNNTTREINQKKKGPIYKWLKNQDTPKKNIQLSALAKESGLDSKL